MTDKALVNKVLEVYGYDQGTLADKIGVRREQVNAWARGRFQPSPNNRAKLEQLSAKAPKAKAAKAKRK